MAKCPECGKDIEHVDATTTTSEDYTVDLDEDKELNWEYEYNRDGDEKHAVINCPECGKIIFQGEYDDAETWLEDFLRGVDNANG